MTFTSRVHLPGGMENYRSVFLNNPSQKYRLSSSLKMKMFKIYQKNELLQKLIEMALTEESQLDQGKEPLQKYLAKQIYYRSAAHCIYCKMIECQTAMINRISNSERVRNAGKVLAATMLGINKKLRQKNQNELVRVRGLFSRIFKGLNYKDAMKAAGTALKKTSKFVQLLSKSELFKKIMEKMLFSEGLQDRTDKKAEKADKKVDILTKELSKLAVKGCKNRK